MRTPVYYLLLHLKEIIAMELEEPCFTLSMAHPRVL
jgi:hypothetical protein